MKKSCPIWRPFLYLIIINITILAISNVYFYRTFSAFYLRHSINELAIRAKLFNREITEIRQIPLIGPNKPIIDQYAREVGELTESRLSLMNNLGYIVGDTLDLPYHSRNYPPRKELNVVKAGDVMMDIRKSTISNENTLFVAVPLYVDGQYQGAGRAARHIRDIEDMRFSVVRDIILFNAAMLLILSCVSYFISRNYTRQLRYINHKAQNLALGDFHTRVKPPKVEEFKILADSFNYMAQAVQIRVKTITTQRNNLNVILNSMTDALIALDQDGAIIDINPAAAEFLGISLEAAQQHKLHEIMESGPLFNFITHALASNLHCEQPVAITDPNGQNRVLRVKCSPIHASAEQPGGCVVVFFDITQITQGERMRREIVSNIFHELRTPLAVIQGSAEALCLSGLAQDQDEREFLDNIVLYSLRLNNLLNDILLLSRVEQNPEEFTTEKHNLFAVIASAVEAVKSKTDNGAAKITIDCPPLLELKINPSMLEMALINLIDNAVKYGGEQEVEIMVTMKENEYHINVIDHGNGIPPDHLKRIFERFYRVDKARSRQTGGTGLGLAIVKHIAQVHGGRVGAQSVLNKGSVFTIILPADNHEA